MKAELDTDPISGETATYQMAAAFLADVDTVEDWGCGAGGFKRFCLAPTYRGIDGSRTPHADEIVDLCAYRSTAEGILLRHVLEHNPRWLTMLDNALASFTRKLCLILFTPLSQGPTVKLADNAPHGVDVPDLSLSAADLLGRLQCFAYRIIPNIPTATGYGAETVIMVWRDPTPRPAVYTAIMGGYDRLPDLPPGIDNGADFICFTDDPTLSHPYWQIRYMDPTSEHPRVAAKRIKCLPHVYLPAYEETLWIDGRFCITDPLFPSEALGHLAGAPMALFAHPERGCIYDEAIVSQLMPKYEGQDIDGQIAAYRAEGHPARGGLYAGGIIARRDCAETRAVNEQWLAECLRWTYQDQLSLPVVLRRCGLAPALFRQYLWATKWGTWGRLGKT